MERNTEFAMIIIAAVAVLIGLAFYPAISPSIGAMTKTFTIVNKTMTMPANGATSELTVCGQKALTNLISNATGGEAIPTSNYTITQAIGTDGYLTAKITTTTSLYASSNVNVSCTYEPKGYIPDGASRGIVGLIMIFMALLIVVAASPNLKSWIFDWMKR